MIDPIGPNSHEQINSALDARDTRMDVLEIAHGILQTSVAQLQTTLLIQANDIKLLRPAPTSAKPGKARRKLRAIKERLNTESEAQHRASHSNKCGCGSCAIWQIVKGA